MLNVTVVQPPRSMDHFPVFFDLCGRQRWTTFSEAMRRNRHDVGRAVGKPDTGAGKRNLHHVLRKVAGRMQHVLVSCCDVASGSVVVSAEVSRNATTFRSSEQQGQIDLSAMIDDRLRGFDHHLEFQTALSELGVLFELCEQRSEERRVGKECRSRWWP